MLSWGSPSELAISEVPEALDDSTAGELSSLAVLAPDDRQFLLVGRPWDPEAAGGAGAEGLACLSTHGYATLGDGASAGEGIPDHRLFPAVLEVPHNLSVSLVTSGRWAPSAEPTYGAIQVINLDRSQDGLLGLYWGGREVSTWLGAAQWIGPSFQYFWRIFRGVVRGINSLGTGVIELQVRGRDYLLDTDANPARYGGHGAALRLDGVDDRADAGDTCDVGAGDSFFLLVRFRDPGGSAYETLAGKRSTGVGYILFVAPGGGLEAFATDGTNSTNPVSALSVRDGGVHAGVFVLDRGAGEARLYRDGVEVASASAASVGSLANAITFRLGERGDAALRFGGDLIEAAWGPRVPTDAEILAWASRPLDSAIDRCLVWPMNEGTGATAFQAHDLAREYLGFDGVDDRLEVSLAAPLYVSGAPDFSVEFTVHDGGPAAAGTLWSEGSTVNSCGVLIRAGGVVTTLIYVVFDDAGVARTNLGWTLQFNGAGPWHGVLVDIGGSVTLYRNGVSLGTQAYSLAGYTVTPNRAGFGARFQAATANYWKGRLHAARLWRRALTAAEIPALAHASTPADPTDLEVQLWLDEATGTPQDTSGNGRTCTLTGATWGAINAAVTGATWVGSLEGWPELQGVRKPTTWGVRRMRRGWLVDPQRMVYQVHDRQCRSIVPRFNGLASLTDEGDVADVYASPPTSAGYVTDLARGLVRLGVAPTAEDHLAFDVEGDAEGGYVEAAARLAERIAVRRGGLSEATEVDGFTVGVVALARPGAAGISTDDQPESVRSLLDRLLTTAGGWWLLSPRTAKLALGLREPPGTPEFEIGENDVELSGVNRLAYAPPSRAQRLGWRPYDVTVPREEAAGSLGDEVKGDLERAWRVVEESADADVVAAHLDAVVLEGELLYDREADVRAEYDRRQEVDRHPWAIYEVPLLPGRGLYQYRVGQTGRMTLPVHDLDAGKLFVVAGYDEDEKTGRVLLRCWARIDDE